MGTASNLSERLDFSIGKEFESRVRRRFGTQVHHASSSPRGSFFLLATFRRSLFRLSEESVSLVLQSCLGGIAESYHVLEVSHNHFRFSVSNKAVGFFIYNLKRVIGTSFDVYFHLWSNGAPHWEREKRLWEAEEAKKWSTVLSKAKKRLPSTSDHSKIPVKRVQFCSKLIQSPPRKMHVPGYSSIFFGSFETPVNPLLCEVQGSANNSEGFTGQRKFFQSVNSCSESNGFQFHSADSADTVFVNSENSVQNSAGSVESSCNLANNLVNLSDLDKVTIEDLPLDVLPDYAVVSGSSVQLNNLNSSQPSVPAGKHLSLTTAPKPALKMTEPFNSLNLGSGFLISNQEKMDFRGGDLIPSFNSAKCSRCMRMGHLRKFCKFPVRCLVCYNYGHWAKNCFLSKTKLFWRPKRHPRPSLVANPKVQWKPKVPLLQQPKEGETTSLMSDSLSSPQEAQGLHPPNSQLELPFLIVPSGTSAGEENPSNSNDALAPTPPSDDHMANFACDPTSFIPFGAHIEDGWQRPARTRVAIGGEPPRRHEEYAIVTLVPPPLPVHARVTLTDVVNLLEANFPVRVESYFLSPLGLGLVEFGSAMQRQSILDISPIAVNDNTELRVVKHDEAINLRACTYTRECWIMFLAFPLDYQNEGFVKAAVAPFGRMLFWRQGRNKGVSLVHCMLLDPTRVPRSVVISQGSSIGGNGRSWSVPTYILGGNFLVAPADEDPIPPDGNPHPAVGAPMVGNPDNYQNWIHDHAGAAAQVLADAGIDEQMMQEGNEEIQINLHQVPEAGQINAQLEAEAEMIEAMMENWVPQHPDQPQDTITFDQSGSTANYLRATGPDIHLTVEEVLATFQNEQNNSDSSSDDSGVVSSDRIHTVVVPDFIVKACQKLPKMQMMPPILVGQKQVEWKEDLSKAIVPVQPVLDCFLLKAWAAMTDLSVDSATLGGQISIPRKVNKKTGAKTPLIDTLVRRSPRINPNVVDGFQMMPLKIKEPATKSRKKVSVQLDLNKKLPTEASEVVNPTSLETIREWAMACGVVPEELTDDVLMVGREDDKEE